MSKPPPPYSQAPEEMIWGLKIAILVQEGDTIKFVGKVLKKREDNRYVYFVTEKYADEMRCLRTRFMKVLRKDEE